LGEDLVSLSLKHRRGALIVIDMEDEQGLAAGADKEGVAEEQVHFRHQQATQHMAEIGGSLRKFHHEDGGLAEGDFMVVQQLGDQGGVADDHPGDGGLGRVDDTEGEDDDPLLLDEFDDLEEGADLVVQKDREMPDRGSGDSFLGGWGELGHGESLSRGYL